MTRSAIYQGRVAHSRPGKHRLRYRVFMLALDIDELPRLSRSLKLFAHNRPSLLSVFDSDHANRLRQPIRPQIEGVLRDAGLPSDGGAVVLLTMPRLLNYVFNPISVYFCYRRDGALAALVHEVSNTFGERFFYALPAEIKDGRIKQTCRKAFFVSPFLEQDLRYAFNVLAPGDRVGIAIAVWRGDQIALTASFHGARSDLNDSNILRAFARNPLMTLKVILGIHWEALRLLMKGVRYLGRSGAAGSSPGRRRRAVGGRSGREDRVFGAEQPQRRASSAENSRASRAPQSDLADCPAP